MQPTHECFTFTGRFPVYRGRISSMIHVSPAGDASSMRLKVRAQWDPGASHTLISKRLFDALNIDFLPTCQNLRTAMGFTSKAPESEVWITIVLGSFPIKLQVCVVDQPTGYDDIDILLGLDFLLRGNFSVSIQGDCPMFSFCYPSLLPVDFHDCLENLNIPHLHVEDNHADCISSPNTQSLFSKK